VGTTQDRLRKAEALFKELIDGEIKGRGDSAKCRNVIQASCPADSGKKSANQVRQAVESNLRRLGLGTEQIRKEDLKGLKNALITMNACIQRPHFYLDAHFKNESIENNARVEIMSVLIERKRILLERYCTMVSSIKVRQIRKILDTIDNEPACKMIDKLLIQLLIKDQFVLEEFRALEK
jgi:hypothetical protein